MAQIQLDRLIIWSGQNPCVFSHTNAFKLYYIDMLLWTGCFKTQVLNVLERCFLTFKRNECLKALIPSQKVNLFSPHKKCCWMFNESLNWMKWFDIYLKATKIWRRRWIYTTVKVVKETASSRQEVQHCNEIDRFPSWRNQFRRLKLIKKK